MQTYSRPQCLSPVKAISKSGQEVTKESSTQTKGWEGEISLDNEKVSPTLVSGRLKITICTGLI